MLSDYAPILVFLGFVVLFAVGVPSLSAALGPRKPSPSKDLPYESGIVPRESARRRFSVSFYVTAMLFIIFDVEAIFFYPWAVYLHKLGWYGVIEMFVFMLILAVALAHIWRKGGLEWD